MTQYNVTGMSCAACQARVEKAVSAVPGVTSVAVSLLTNSMGVEGDAKPKDIIRAVKDAGYGASEKGRSSGVDSRGDVGSGSGESASYFIEEAMESLRDTETPKMLKRLGWSVGFLLILMYFSMGAHMWGWPLPSFYTDNHIAMGLTQMLLAIVVMMINKRFFVSGFKSLWHRAPNMDSLVALGSAASFLYSTYALFAMTRAQVDGGSAAAMPYMNSFYFESAAMILALITVGKTLESYSKGKTTNALKGLLSLAPKVAIVERTVDGAVQELEVPIDQVVSGDIFVVRPGEQIPVDGFVLEGSGAVDESSLTGESIPVDKKDGDTVSAGTINQSGFLRCKATRVGQDTTLSQIIKMVSDAAATKAPIAKIADKVSGVFVPAVIGIAVLVLIIWLFLGQSFAFAMTRAVSVLVISCPCALGLATPVAIMVGNGKGARNGILFKTAVSLEETGKIAAIALDKTGTITEGRPKVTDLIPLNDSTEGELLQMAYLLERRSEHPLAKAIVEEGLSWNFDAGDEAGADGNVLTDFTALPGNGLSGTLNGVRLIGGNLELMRQNTTYPIPDDVVAKAEALAGQGKTPMFFAADGELLGIIAVADVIKEDSCKGIHELQNMGIHVVMLTGDNLLTANAIAASAGVDEVIAGVLPDGKAEVIRQLQQKYGKVAMVGDGINDAPALTMADMGKIAAIALDKTGTITEGRPKVTDLIPLNDSTEGELLQMAYLLERRSEHPLAKAIVEEGLSWNFDAGDEAGADGNVLTDFTALPGNGLSGTLNGVRLIGGNLELMRQNTTYPIPDDVVAKAEALAGQGKTPMFFAADGELLGIIAVADVIKEDSCKGIHELQNMGIHVVMLTGDNLLTANAIAASAGVDEVIAGVLPDGKAEVIRQLQQKYGKVAMVGDGINDAPALTMADMGIAIGAGTDVAIDAADVVLMNSKLTDVSAAVRLSRQTLRNIKQNLFWAFFYNVICIPLAAGCYHSLGLDLNPMIGAAAMSLSSFCVVMNALRLNLFQIRNTKYDKPRKNRWNNTPDLKGAITMNEKTIKVEGMMCGHCEASVKKALEEVKHVVSATADHESGTVNLQLDGDVKEAKLKKAVEDAGYKYLG